MIWKAIWISFCLVWASNSMDQGIGTCDDHGIGTCVDHGIGTCVDHGIGTCVDHGIYITVIEINQNNEGGQVVIKSFSDDLVNALRAMNFNIPQDANPCEEADALNVYVDEHLNIQINGMVLDLKINECTKESDTHWVYLDFELEENWNKVNVETDWMTELFGNQQNIIKVQSGDQRLNDRLSAEKTLSILTIDN